MSGPSRGRKQCPNCKAYVGVRLGQCVCKYVFAAAAPKPPKVAKVFDGPGRAIKRCPCGTYVHAKLAICPTCNQAFPSKKERKAHAKPATMTAEVKTYDVGGLGRKQCPSCKKFVGARNMKCACGYDFKSHVAQSGEVVEPVVAPSKQTENDKWRDVAEEALVMDFAKAVGASKCTVIYTPNGDSPVKLTAKNDASFRMFCEALIEYGIENKKLYSPRALRCFGRQFMAQDSKDYFNFYAFVTKYVEGKIAAYKAMMNPPDIS